MTGISITWILLTTLALILLVACAPSGSRKALHEVVSMELYWAGAFLTLVLALSSILIWIWRIELHELFGQPYNWFSQNIWPSFVSTIFGAFLWILLSLGTRRRLRLFPLLLSLAYVVLMAGINYLAELQCLIAGISPLVASEDEALKIVSSLLLAPAIGVLVYLYATKQRHLTNDRGSSREFPQTGTLSK